MADQVRHARVEALSPRRGPASASHPGAGAASQFRISEAAQLLRVSDDTVRRWLNAGHLPHARDPSGRMVIDGAALAAFARRRAQRAPASRYQVVSPAPNRFVGLVTNVITGTVMSQIELLCGPVHVVSLISTEATGELGLVPGCVAVAVVQAAQVVIERSLDAVALPVPRGQRSGDHV